MSTLRTPVGPQPPSVYWRRRILVLLGLLAVVVVIVLIVVRPGAGDPGRETPKPTDTPSVEPTDAAATGECDPAVIRIEPVTDAESYQAGQQPQISMTITNTGSRPCEFDVGPGAQQYLIVSGADPIWSSTDCLQGDSLVQTLEPNTPLSTTPFAWDRTRSSATTCDSSRPEVVAGGATYRLSVKLGPVESSSDAPFLLY
jgi:hypothetical protein